MLFANFAEAVAEGRGTITYGNRMAAEFLPVGGVTESEPESQHRPESSWIWRAYALAVLAFGLVSTLLLYLILRLQGWLPLNPSHAPGMSPVLSFNTAISFITGTDWQAYEGETAASYFAQMGGLVVAQFTAAAIGLSVALAIVRGMLVPDCRPTRRGMT